MRRARPDTRRLWLPLAAFAGALLWGSGSATACSTLKARACATACGCCDPEPSGAGGDIAAAAELPLRIIAPPAAQASDGAPAGGCSCRAEPQDAPEPRARTRADDERAGSPLDLAAPPIAVAPAPMLPARSLPPGTGTPQGTPLYLRNSRLLI